MRLGELPSWGATVEFVAFSHICCCMLLLYILAQGREALKLLCTVLGPLETFSTQNDVHSLQTVVKLSIHLKEVFG